MRKSLALDVLRFFGVAMAIILAAALIVVAAVAILIFVSNLAHAGWSYKPALAVAAFVGAAAGLAFIVREALNNTPPE